MSLADARVEITADLSTFRAQLRAEMAEAAEAAGALLDKRMQKSADKIKASFTGMADTLRSQLSNASRDGFKVLNDQGDQATRRAKLNFRGIGTTFRDNLVGKANSAFKEFDERATNSARRVRDGFKESAKSVGDGLSDAGKRGFKDIDAESARSAGRIKDTVRATSNVVSRQLGVVGKAAKAALSDIDTGKIEAAGDRIEESIARGARAGSRAAASAMSDVGDSLGRSARRGGDDVVRAASSAGKRASRVLVDDLEAGSKSIWARFKEDAGIGGTAAGQKGGYSILSGIKFSLTAGAGFLAGKFAAAAAVIAPLLSPILAILSAAVADAVSLGSALSTAVVGGALAAAAAVAAIGSAFAVIKVGSSGLFAALKQSTVADKSASSSTGETATQQRAAQTQIENATQAVTAAKVKQAKAERELTDAQTDQKAAREALTESYVKARRALEDYDNAVKDTANDEEDAALKAGDAHEALRKAYADRTTTPAQRQALQVAADEADQAQVEAGQNHQRAVEDDQSANAKGIEGSDDVVAAKKALREAQEAVVDGQQAVKDAVQDVSNAIRDQTTAIADASDKAADSASSADTELNKLIADLAPNARVAYYAAKRLQAAYKEMQKSIQQKLFAGIGADIDKLSTRYMPGLTQASDGVAGSVNKAANTLADFLLKGSTTKRIATIFHNNQAGVDAFAGAVTPLADIFITLLEVISPYEKRIGQLVTAGLQWADTFLETKKNSGQLQKFLDTAWGDFLRVLDIVKNVLGGIFGILQIANPYGQSFLASIDNAAISFDNFANNPKNRGKIAHWFDEGKAAAGAFKGFLDEVGNVFSDLAGKSDPAKVISGLTGTLTQVKRIVDQITGTKGGSGGQSVIDLINGLLTTLADAQVGTFIKNFVDNVGEIVSVFASLVSTLKDVAKHFGPANSLLGATVKILGLLAALKFVAAITGTSKLLTGILKLGGRGVLALLGKVATGLGFGKAGAASKASTVAEEVEQAATGSGGSKKTGAAGALSSILGDLECIPICDENGEAIGGKAAKAEKTASTAETDAVDAATGGGGTRAEKRAAKKAAKKAGTKIAEDIGGDIAENAAAANVGKLGKIKGAVKKVAASIGSSLFPAYDAVTDATGSIGRGGTVEKEAKAAAKAVKKPGRFANVLSGLASDTGGGNLFTGGTKTAGTVAKDAGKVGDLAKDAAQLEKSAGSAAKLAGEVGGATKSIKIVTAASKVWTGVQLVLDAALDANPIGLIVLAIAALVAGVIYAYTHFDSFRKVVNTVWDALRRFGSFVATFFTKTLPGWVESGVAKLVGAVEAIPGRLAALGGKLLAAGKSLFTSFLNGFSDIGSFAEKIGRSVANAVTGLLNKGIDFINSALNKIPSILRAGKDLSHTLPEIPRLGHGAVVDRPTLAVIGEAGPEVVIPLTRPARAAELAQQSGLVAMLQLREILPAPAVTVTAPPPTSAQTSTQTVDKSVHIGELHVHHNGRDTGIATYKALARAARLAMS